MKKSLIAFVVLSVLAGSIFAGFNIAKPAYSAEHVDVSSYSYQGKSYQTITLNRTKGRVKAKYFAYKDGNSSVYERYNKWKNGRNIIMVSSGTYMDKNSPRPEGLTIDNGIPINRDLNAYDAFVIVYATGGIVVADLKTQNVNMTCNSAEKSYNLKNTYDKAKFIECAQQVEATTFQTHLLVFKDQLKIYNNSSPTARERRFLAACKYGNELYHVVVHVKEAVSLKSGTEDVFNFLKKNREFDEVVFMINLDTGMQDVFTVYDPNGAPYKDIKGAVSITEAVNLLVYYYE